MGEPQAIDQDKISAMRREAERIEEDATYSSKSHFNAEGIWERRHYWLGVPATALAAITGATLIKSLPELASACALSASLLTGLMTFLKPNERAAIPRAAQRRPFLPGDRVAAGGSTGRIAGKAQGTVVGTQSTEREEPKHSTSFVHRRPQGDRRRRSDPQGGQGELTACRC